ncbi:MAG: hypothetical protein AAB521_02330 [Patescibacteria group bacterium]
MSQRTKKYAFILQGIYVFLFFAFLLSAFTADVLFAPPALAILRVPSNIRGIGEAIGAPWTQNLRLYHILLLITTIVGSLNLLGLSSLHSRFWRGALRLSSFLGLIILTCGIIFFLLPFLIGGQYSSVFLRTSIVYAIVAFVILLVNFATFALAVKVPLISKKR